MPAVRNVAIAGGGVAGMATAILLAESGIEVDVFEAKTTVADLGSGITLQGNALRVFERLGVWEAVRQASYGFDVVGLRAPGPDATVIAEIPDQRTGGPAFPATVGMYRPDLARILTERAHQVGARVHLGTSVGSISSGLSPDDERVEFTTSDGRLRTVDLLVGADGLHSTVRSLMGIEVEPRRTGMGIWRAFVDRPESVTHTELYYGGPCFIAGYCPTGPSTMYAYLVEESQDHSGVSGSQAASLMKELSSAYHGPWDDIRENLDAASRVNYTWFTTHTLPGAWNRNRTVLIGEAAHSCPPTIAQGAAMAVEDADVLSELLLSETDLTTVWQMFHDRRVPRATAVVDASVQLGDWLLEGRRDAPIPELMGRIGTLVSVPA